MEKKDNNKELIALLDNLNEKIKLHFNDFYNQAKTSSSSKLLDFDNVPIERKITQGKTRSRKKKLKLRIIIIMHENLLILL